MPPNANILLGWAKPQLANVQCCYYARRMPTLSLGSKPCVYREGRAGYWQGPLRQFLPSTAEVGSYQQSLKCEGALQRAEGGAGSTARRGRAHRGNEPWRSYSCSLLLFNLRHQVYKIHVGKSYQLAPEVIREGEVGVIAVITSPDATASKKKENNSCWEAGHKNWNPCWVLMGNGAEVLNTGAGLSVTVQLLNL